EGGGYAIGRAGLVAALHQHDGRGDPTSLYRATIAQFGNLDGLPALVHGAENRARTVAAFAPAVLDAARAGDPEAVRIRAAAAQRLAQTTRAAASVLSGALAADISVVGGLAEDADLMRQYDAALRASGDASGRPLCRRDAVGDALGGAHLLAGEPDLPHHSLVVRFAAEELR